MKLIFKGNELSDGPAKRAVRANHGRYTDSDNGCNPVPRISTSPVSLKYTQKFIVSMSSRLSKSARTNKTFEPRPRTKINPKAASMAAAYYWKLPKADPGTNIAAAFDISELTNPKRSLSANESGSAAMESTGLT